MLGKHLGPKSENQNELNYLDESNIDKYSQHITFLRNMFNFVSLQRLLTFARSTPFTTPITSQSLQVMTIETHKASVILGYTLLISAILYYQIEEETNLPILTMVMSGIIMLILSKYVEYRQQAPYNVVTAITIAIAAYLLYTIIPLTEKPETLLIILHSVLGVFGAWVSILMVKGMKIRRTKN